VNKKPKRLKNFDFSVKGAHVALVDQAANGKEKFLTVKSFMEDLIEDLQEDLDEAKAAKEVEDKARAVIVEMPLVDLLVEYGIWRETANMLVASIKRASPEADKIIQQVHSDIVSLSSVGASGASESGGLSPAYLIAKSKKEAAMSDKENAPDQVDVQELLKSVQAQNEVIKSLQEQVDANRAAEAAREAARYVEITKKYESLGLEEVDATVVQAIARIEGSEKILKALDTALDLVNNVDKLSAQGKGGSSEGASVTTELELKAKEIQAAEGCTLPQATVKAIAKFPHLVK
jgi:hypothetical protein